MMRISKKTAAIAVIIVCLLVNIALWTMPDKKDDSSGDIGQAAEPLQPVPEDEPDQVPSETVREAVASAPIPADLPEGTSGDQVREVLESCMEQNGFEGAQSLSLADSGTSAAIEGGTPAARWWLYTAVMPDGQTVSMTVGHTPEKGFYAGVQ